MGTDGVLRGVGTTALGVAMVRAQESRRSDRLFDDPYAAGFLEAAPDVFAEERRRATAGNDMGSWGAAFYEHAAIRTRFFDDYLRDAVEQGLRQVVLLAAGLDTRAYRLAWPEGVRLFELDLPEVLTFKERVLAERKAAAQCQRISVPADVRGDWPAPLFDSGFQAAEPTAWLVEGLLIYLSADEAADLLTTVGQSSAISSRCAFEHETLGTDVMRSRARDMPAMADYAAMWKGGLPDAPTWLATHGWRPKVHDRATVTTRYGRSPVTTSAGGFLTAELHPASPQPDHDART